jgi:hypothetical protein
MFGLYPAPNFAEIRATATEMKQPVNMQEQFLLYFLYALYVKKYKIKKNNHLTSHVNRSEAGKRNTYGGGRIFSAPWNSECLLAIPNNCKTSHQYPSQLSINSSSVDTLHCLNLFKRN